MPAKKGSGRSPNDEEGHAGHDHGGGDHAHEHDGE
jgi:hypothetical protein